MIQLLFSYLLLYTFDVLINPPLIPTTKNKDLIYYKTVTPLEYLSSS